MTYRLHVPAQAVSASVAYFDLFNATDSASEIQLLYVLPIVSGAAAITGAIAVDLALTRTTAVGTGGTAATREGTALTAATFTAMDQDPGLSSKITARLTPTGGATAGAVIALRSVFTEETNAGTYTSVAPMVRPTPDMWGVKIKENSGIRVVQGATAATTGNIGFDVVFNVIPK